jgi:hypothetical protein
MKLSLEKVKGNFIVENIGKAPFDYTKTGNCLNPGDKAIWSSSKDVLKGVEIAINNNQ